MQRLLLWSILVICAVQIALNVSFWYDTHPWVDIPVHFSGGAWIALLFFYLFGEKYPSLPRNRAIQVVFAVSFAVWIAAGWEIFEYLVGVYVAHSYPFGSGRAISHFDSLKDIFVGFLGASAAALLYVRATRRGRGS